MRRIILIALFLIVYQDTGYLLDTLSLKYYPLQIGNSWTYFHVHVGNPSSSSKYKLTITGTTTFGGHLYFITNSASRIRVDSLNGKFLIYDTNYGCPWLNNERLIDSLQARIHDSCRSECQDVYTKCIDTAGRTIFGTMKPAKTFRYYDNFETSKFRGYVKDIGLVFTFTQYGSPSYDTDTLKGCVINGVVYGDTSIVGLQPVSLEVLSEFSLFQNYPNPFNPTTKIKFSIPPSKGARGMTLLIIYDILGREIATLVNEQLKPGTYEVEWDGSNYTSGVYFYKLITQDYSETKKMVLVK
jgi:hypothetical protein